MAEEERDTVAVYDRDSVRFPTDLVVLLILIPPIFAEWRNQQPVRSRNGKVTKYLMIGVMTFNTLSQLLWAGQWIGCANCGLHMCSIYISKALIKGINMAFLIHRAKLVQGMSPVLSKKWFEKILPAIVVGIIVILISATIKSFLDPNLHWICVTANHWESGTRCSPDIDQDDQNSSDSRKTAALAIALDVVITTFLMVLFVVPLYRINHNDIGVMNENQMKQRRKLKRLLIWSVLLTFISQVTSTLNLVKIVHRSSVTGILFLIGLFDPAINIWTLWLMVSRNRQSVQRICFCTRCGEALSRQHSVALTDISSRLKSVSLRQQQDASQPSGIIIDPDPDLQICN